MRDFLSLFLRSMLILSFSGVSPIAFSATGAHGDCHEHSEATHQTGFDHDKVMGSSKSENFPSENETAKQCSEVCHTSQCCSSYLPEMNQTKIPFFAAIVAANEVFDDVWRQEHLDRIFKPPKN